MLYGSPKMENVPYNCGHPWPRPQNPSSGTDNGRREKEKMPEYVLKIFTYKVC